MTTEKPKIIRLMAKATSPTTLEIGQVYKSGEGGLELVPGEFLMIEMTCSKGVRFTGEKFIDERQLIGRALEVVDTGAGCVCRDDGKELSSLLHQAMTEPAVVPCLEVIAELDVLDAEHWSEAIRKWHERDVAE